MDFPIVRRVATWWDGTEWAIQNPRKSQESDPYRLLINGYRVLLTGGRDGMIILCRR
jgi:hypothetical protein